MANSDYAVRGGTPGGFTPYAVLAEAMSRDATAVSIEGLQTTVAEALATGVAVLIGNEIMRLDGIAGGRIHVARGCADTIPAEHTEGEAIWFFGRTWVTDGVEYGSGETVGVKPLVSTPAGGRMPTFASPPQNVALSGRAVRPYPPAALLVNGDPWIAGVDPDLQLDDDNDIVLAWAHRNRLVQAEVLVGHTEGSITPEDGTTYRVRIFNASDTLLDTESGIDGTTYNVVNLVGLESATYLLFDSERDGLYSSEAYRIDFTGAGGGYGFGLRFGEGFGGVAP